MLQQAARFLLRAEPSFAASLQHLSGCASASAPMATVGYATNAANPQDYSLVMKTAAEISSNIQKPRDREVGLTAGVPLETFGRKARIFAYGKSPSQSGLGKTTHQSNAAPAWKIEFDNTAKWENPLIGWTSTADPLENVARASLSFYNKEQAMDFCKKHGWEYTVEEPNKRRTDRQKRWAGYGDNFSIKRKGLPDLSHLPSVKQGLGTPTSSSSSSSSSEDAAPAEGGKQKKAKAAGAAK